MELPMRRVRKGRVEASDLCMGSRAYVRAWARGEAQAAELASWLDVDTPAELRPQVSWLCAAVGLRFDVISDESSALLDSLAKGPRELLASAGCRLREENSGRSDLTDEEVNLTFRRLLFKARQEPHPATAYVRTLLWQELVYLERGDEDAEATQVPAHAILDAPYLVQALTQAGDTVRSAAEMLEERRLEEENWCFHRYLCAIARTHKTLQESIKAMERADAYGLLGVGEDADASMIKRAYRDMCLKHHPDKGGDAENFQACRVAYTYLLGEIGRDSKDGLDGTEAEQGKEEAEKSQEIQRMTEALEKAAARAPDLADEAVRMVQLAVQAVELYLDATELMGKDADCLVAAGENVVRIGGIVAAKVSALGGLVLETSDAVEELGKLTAPKILETVAHRCNLLGAGVMEAAQQTTKTMQKVKRALLGDGHASRATLSAVEAALQAAGTVALQAATTVHEALFHATASAKRPREKSEKKEEEEKKDEEKPEEKSERGPVEKGPKEAVLKRMRHTALFQQLNKDTLALQRRFKQRVGTDILPEVTVLQKKRVFDFAAAVLDGACVRIERAADASEEFRALLLDSAELAAPALVTGAATLRACAAIDGKAAGELVDEVLVRLEPVDIPPRDRHAFREQLDHILRL